MKRLIRIELPSLYRLKLMVILMAMMEIVMVMTVILMEILMEMTVIFAIIYPRMKG